MKKILKALLITTMLIALGTVGSFADYTAQFDVMKSNISTLELKVAHLEELLNSENISTKEIDSTKEEISSAKKELEVYKTSMATLEQLSKPVEEEKATTTQTTSNPAGMKYAGNFRLTAYCPCYSCSEGWGTQTASGNRAKEGVTVAASKQFPLGTKLYIEGVGYRTVHDRGGAIKGSKIDVYVNSHSSCYTPAYNTTTKVYIVQ